MCLIAMAIDQSRQFPLVIAANRDEYFARPAARLGWWTPEGGGPAVLAGRDLQQGGTWLGLTAAGRLAMVTNVRDSRRADPEAPSRGLIVPRWLSGRFGLLESRDTLHIEARFPAETIAELDRRGHLLNRWGDWNEFAGHAHGILIDPQSGMRYGGSDPRSDGAAIGF